MNTKIAMFTVGVGAAGLFATGCAETADDLESPTAEAAEDSAEGGESAIESVGSTLNSSGQYCGGYCIAGGGYLPGYGTCYGGNFLNYTYLPNVTQDCRARIVDYCHNRGWHFGDAYWSTGRPYAGWKCSMRS